MHRWTDLDRGGRAPGRAGDERHLTASELASVVDEVAEQAAVWRDRLCFPDVERWYGLLHTSPTLEIWLLTWQQETSTELHDHGDAAGAFRVVEGELEEVRTGLAGRSLRRRTLGAGTTGSFSRGYIHDLGNRRSVPAVSVHAYSPPLTSMTFYERRGPELVAVRTEQSDQWMTAPAAVAGA